MSQLLFDRSADLFDYLMAENTYKGASVAGSITWITVYLEHLADIYPDNAIVMGICMNIGVQLAVHISQ